jgi:hypothetical protein
VSALAHPVESSLTVIGSGEPISQENLVQLHLLYSGPLHPSGNTTEKLAIRRVFHSQLSRLWEVNPNLKLMAQRIGLNDYLTESAQTKSEFSSADISPAEAVRRGLQVMGRNWNRNEFNYVPLVTAELCLRCKLDILFLRMEERDYVLQGGDIDGRLKTLFDALRMAREANELPRRAEPSHDEHPFFCLLENDDLVSEVNIVTGQLLRLPESQAVDKHQVYLQISVQLNPVQQSRWSWVF